MIDFTNELIEHTIIDESYLIEIEGTFCSIYATWKDQEIIQEHCLSEEALINYGDK